MVFRVALENEKKKMKRSVMKAVAAVEGGMNLHYLLPTEYFLTIYYILVICFGLRMSSMLCFSGVCCSRPQEGKNDCDRRCRSCAPHNKAQEIRLHRVAERGSCQGGEEGSRKGIYVSVKNLTQFSCSVNELIILCQVRH
jgi:hypothetical protein